MRLVWIDPVNREINVIEALPEVLVRDRLLEPQGLIDLDPTTAMVVCTVGTIGSNVGLWWHHELREVFGGVGFVAGVGQDGTLTGVDEGTWLKTKRSIEFLGMADEALPRLRVLVRRAMGEGDPDPRQGVLALEPSNDLSRR